MDQSVIKINTDSLPNSGDKEKDFIETTKIFINALKAPNIKLYRENTDKFVISVNRYINYNSRIYSI